MSFSSSVLAWTQFTAPPWSRVRPALLPREDTPGTGGSTDPGITINWDYWPFMAELKDAVGGVAAIVIVMCVAALIVGGLGWLISRFAGSSRGQSVTASIFGAVAIVAMIVGGASAIIGWAASRDLGF